MAELPQNVEAFIQQQIDSVGQLEALLLLFRTRGRRWRAGELAHRLYVEESEAQSILRRLVDRGFLERSEDTVAFRQEDADLIRQVEEIQKYYTTHLIPISKLIHSKASPRIQEFADAFTFKQKK